MQGEAIVNRILSDGKIKANEIIEEAKSKASKINQDAQDFATQKNLEANEIANKNAEQIAESYKILTKIEGNKIMLNKRQEILSNLKSLALQSLLKLDSAKMLSLIEKLLNKNASKGETLRVGIPSVKLADIQGLKVVKDKTLKVVKNSSNEIGLVLSNANFDKNLLFEELINETYEKCQSEITALLFPNVEKPKNEETIQIVEKETNIKED